VNYTYFFDEKIPSSSQLSKAGDEVKLDSYWGWAAQVGVDIAMNQHWFSIWMSNSWILIRRPVLKNVRWRCQN